MRIAIVVNSFPTLSETFIFNKVKGLLDAGIDVTVVAASRKNDKAAYSEQLFELKNLRLRYTLSNTNLFRFFVNLISLIVSHPKTSFKLFKDSRRNSANLKQASKKFILALPLKVGNYDIIHFELSGIVVGYVDLLTLLRPARLITSCRGAAEQITPLVDPARGEKLRLVFNELDAVHCVSQDILKTAEEYGLDRKKVFVNHPAIDPEKFQRRSPYPVKLTGPYHLLSVGRLHWKKGVNYGLLAVKKIISQGYDVYFDIIGGGPEEEHLKFLIHDLGLSDHVQLLGRQSPNKVRELLEQTDVFVLPSVSEGISNAVLEAMAMELPIVSTKAGGMEEAITDGIEGFLVQPYRPDLMAEKIATLLEDPSLRLNFGQAARKKIMESFHLNSQITRYLLHYHQIIQS